MAMIPFCDTSIYNGFGVQKPYAHDYPTGIPTNVPITITLNSPAFVPNLTKAITLGVKGFLHRASNAEVVDPSYAVMAKACKAAGLPIGPYGYIRPDRCDYKKHVETFVRSIELSGVEPSLPPMADCEQFYDQHKWSHRAYGDFLHGWLNEAEQQLGIKPIIYTGDWWWGNPKSGYDGHVGNDVGAEFEPYDFVLSDYVVKPIPLPTKDWEAYAFSKRPQGPDLIDGEPSWAAWQFTAGATASAYGFAGESLDGNLCKPEHWTEWLERCVKTLPVPVPTTVVVVRVPLTQSRSKYSSHECNILASMLSVFLAGAGKPGLGYPGAYTTEVEKAVRWFQENNNLVIDGICGPKTWSALIPSAPG